MRIAETPHHNDLLSIQTLNVQNDQGSKALHMESLAKIYTSYYNENNIFMEYVK